MRLQDLEKLLKTSELKVFFVKTGREISTPYIIYGVNSQPDFKADDYSYQTIINCYIELYTNKKEIEIENKIKNLFKNNNISYSFDYENFIETEKLYIVRWIVEFLGE